MGAVAGSKGQFAEVSLRHESEPKTIGIVSSTGKPGPHRFARVPTYTVGVAHERRCNPRAALQLPLRLTRVDNVAEAYPVTLVTRNISSSGIFFLAPRDFVKGQSVELEVALIERPYGQGSVQMCTAAHIVRCEDADMPGWRGYAATFDDFAIKRDDVVPLRYRSH
ncbi:MAG: PilZ domain-containing protein [Candidatus Acidiferrales bacterium]